jgi:transcriptional regulator with XRE-family HTH domain
MPITFSQSVARRVRALRVAHGMSQEDLAAALANRRTPIDRSSIARLEKGKRSITVDELMWLARALHVAPVHLLVDPDGDEAITPGPGLEASPHEAREWIRGRFPMPFQDPRFYWTHVPEEDFKRMQKGELP